MRRIVFLGIYCGVFSLFASPRVWVDAEAFQETGGWIIDQQSFSQIGSAYLMAHGLGTPVADATTPIRIPETGTWHAWVRTRDWTAVWKRGTPAGRFELKVNGRKFPAVLGTNGRDWAWQKAGSLPLMKGDVALALHDLTGFNGRCDAVFLTTDETFTPPNSLPELDAFRKEVTGKVRQDAKRSYDLIVVGGGLSGVCTAFSAAWLGNRVLLIQDRGVLGGCNSSEVRVSVGGQTELPPYPNLGRLVSLITPIAGSGATYSAEYYEDDRKAHLFSRLPPDQCTVLFNTYAFAVEMDPARTNRIAALIYREARTGREFRVRSRLFADCTGDAVIARLAGASVMYGREARSEYNESLAPVRADRTVMGMSVIWYSRKDARPRPFPDIDWGIPFSEKTCYYIRKGDWEWETGFTRDQYREAEYIRDYGLMTMFANWSFLKNHSVRKAEWATDTLEWASPVGGKRESYRVKGDFIVTQNDIEKNIVQPDCTASATWNLDQHFADPENAEKFGEPFRSCAYHRGFAKAYPVPYRCLYSRDVENLFVGGRSISVTHSAFSAMRVMRTLGTLGEVIGIAATICREKKCLPRDVATTHLHALQEGMRRGIWLWPYHSPAVGLYENYHFKDYGYFETDDEIRRKHVSPQVEAKYQQWIKKLGMTHRKDEQ